MVMSMELNCDYLLLPRPWLNQAGVSADQLNREKSLKHALYVRGNVLIGGRSISLPYWHEVVLIKDLES